MPTINLSKANYESLQQLMSLELKARLKSEGDKALLQVIKSKFGITFDFMISKLIQEYKRNHQITK